MLFSLTVDFLGSDSAVTKGKPSCIHPIYILHISCIHPAYILHTTCIHPAYILHITCIHPAYILYTSCMQGIFYVCAAAEPPGYVLAG